MGFFVIKRTGTHHWSKWNEFAGVNCVQRLTLVHDKTKALYLVESLKDVPIAGYFWHKIGRAIIGQDGECIGEEAAIVYADGSYDGFEVDYDKTGDVVPIKGNVYELGLDLSQHPIDKKLLDAWSVST